MVHATTLVAWLGVQDCRHIKDYPASRGGVILSTLEQTGASRLVLLSTLHSSLTHAYLEALSLAWPGEISLHAFEQDTVDMARLWPWAQDVFERDLPVLEIAEPGHEPAFLLGAALPACQAVFLAHGMSGAACRLIEPRRDGALQSVAVPKIVRADAGGDALNVADVAAELADMADVTDLSDVADDVDAAMSMDDAEDSGALPQPDAAPEVTEIPDASDWAVEEVALQPVRDLEFPEHLDDDLIEAGEAAQQMQTHDEGDAGNAQDGNSEGEPQIELLAEDTSDWNVEEVALQPVTEIEFDTVSIEADAPGVDADFDIAVAEETAPAIDADFDALGAEQAAAEEFVAEEFVAEELGAGEVDAEEALSEAIAAEETLASVDADFDLAVPEETTPAIDADFDALGAEQAAAEEFVAEELGAGEVDAEEALSEAIAAEETLASVDADFDLAVPEETTPAIDADFDLAVPEDSAPAIAADFDMAVAEETAPAIDADFEALAAEQSATEQIATEQTAAADDMALEFPDVSSDPFDFDAELGKTGSLAEEMPAKADEIERLQAEFAAGELQQPVAEEQDPFEAAQAALADVNGLTSESSANADALLTDDQDPFEAAQAALADEASSESSANADALLTDDQDPFEAAQAALADEAGCATSANADASPADDQDFFEAAQAAQADESEQVEQTASTDQVMPTPADAPHASPWPYASHALSVLVRRADTLAATEAPALILGEPGCGAKLLASRMHEHSSRSAQLIVMADLAAMHVDAQAAELWGEVNALTGAHTAGFVELAQGGTLLIAGLELMTPLVQSQLLTLMTRGDCMPMGAEQAMPVDVRIMAAASESLLTELKAGRFNRQLFDLFGKGLLTIPALRKRPEDLPALVDAIWTHIQDSSDSTRSAPTLAQAARDWLLEHGFTGTVRDLELALRRAVLWTRGDEVSVDTLKESMALASVPEAVANCTQAIREGFSLKDVVFSVTKHFVHQALVQSAYDLDRAAALLGVGDSQALLGWMARVDIVLPRNLEEAPKSTAEATFENVCDETQVDAAFDAGISGADSSVAANDPVADAAASLDADFDSLASGTIL